MAKETFYFTHDYNARNDDKILELRSKYGAEGYGIFWMIVETMAENENGGVKATLIGGLSLGYGVAKATLLEFIHYCIEIGLFYKNDDFLFSKRMLTHKELRNMLSVSGKAGAKKRWEKNSPPNSPPNAKERKGKEIKEKNIIVDKKKDLSKFPFANSFNGLPEIKIGAAKELMRASQSISVSTEQIESFWSVFKIQHLTGENFYNSEAKVYSHFINWVKDKKVGSSASLKNAAKPLGEIFN